MRTSSSIISLALALACSATAAPTSSSTTGGTTWTSSTGQTVISYVAAFDEISNDGAAPGVPVRDVGRIVGPYDNLEYNIGVIGDIPAGAGLRPFSEPNCLAFDFVQTTQSPQTITSKFDNSIADYFNFKSFYFGCVVTNAETKTSVPTNCKINVSGSRNGVAVAAQSFTFTAAGTLQGMDQAILNSAFANVDTVQFVIASAITVPTGASLPTATTSYITAALFDNLVYDVYIKKGSSTTT